jgi:hypothetical protein
MCGGPRASDPTRNYVHSQVAAWRETDGMRAQLKEDEAKLSDGGGGEGALAEPWRSKSMGEALLLRGGHALRHNTLHFLTP